MYIPANNDRNLSNGDRIPRTSRVAASVRFFAFALLLTLTNAALLEARDAPAANLAGRIISPLSETPISYAVIELRNGEGLPVMKGATDAKGEFTLEHVFPGTYRLAFGPVGAAAELTPAFTVSNETHKLNLGTIAFRGQITRLEQFEVAAKKEAFENSIDRKTYLVGSDIRGAGGSVSDLLQSIPSVQVDVDGNVSLRGDANVLVLLDGKTSTQLSTVNRPDVLAQMSADNLERVEVITNPSSRFKADGTAGIINLVTKRQRVGGLAGTWKAVVGNNQRGSLAGSLVYNRGDYSLYTNASVRQDDRVRLVEDQRSHLDPASGTWVNTRQEGREHMRPLSRLALLGMDWRPSKQDKLGLSGNYTLRTFFRESTTTNQTGSPTGALSVDYDRQRADREWQKTSEIKSSYSHSFAEDGHELAIELKHDRHQELENNIYLNSYRTPMRPPTRDFTLIKPTETGTEVTADYARPLAEGSKLEAGISSQANKNDMDYRGALTDPNTSSWINDASRTNRFVYDDLIEAFYATLGGSFGKLGVLAGIRFEDTIVKTSQVTSGANSRTGYWRSHPSLHLTWQATETGQIQLNYSHRVHRPETDDLNPFPQYQDPFNLRAGNPRLLPEETHSVEGGYQYHRDDITYVATAYLRDTYHGFTTVSRYVTPVTLLTTHENLARSHSGGLELVSTRSLGDHLSLNASLNVFRSQVDASNLGFTALRSATATSAKLNLNWRPAKRDTVQLDSSYSAKRLTAQGFRSPVTVANLGWRHELAAKQHVLSLTVSDILNSLRERTLVDTPLLHEEITRRRNSRVVYLAYGYTFGQSAKKGKKDELQFDNSL